MRIFLHPICLVALMLAVHSPRGEAETVRLTAGEWKPYISETMEHYGPFSQIVAEAFAMEGIRVEYRFYPWKRAVLLARHGKLDGSIAIVRTPERERVFWYSDAPVLVGDRVFFHLKSFRFDWKAVPDLAGMRIGATLEYFYGEPFESAEAAGRIRVDRVPTDLHNLRKILRGRVDIFPLTREVGIYLLNTEFPPGDAAMVTHHPKPLSSIPFHIVLARNIEENERRVKAFDRGFRRLRESGRYERILEKWW